MRNYSMKLIVLIAAVFILLLTISGCPTEPPPLTSAIFSNVIKIDISPVSGSMLSSGFFSYELPEEVKYAIVELFDGHIEIPDDPDKKVPLEHLVAGSRTGFTNFTRSSVRASELYPVNADKTDFDTTGGYYSGTTVAQPHTWIVLGYDENMILTHASTAGKVTITWP